MSLTRGIVLWKVKHTDGVNDVHSLQDLAEDDLQRSDQHEVDIAVKFKRRHT